MGSNQRDLSIPIERVLCVDIFTARYVPAQNGNSESMKVGSEVKNIFFSNTVQDYGKAVGQAGNSLSMRKLQSLWFNRW